MIRKILLVIVIIILVILGIGFCVGKNSAVNSENRVSYQEVNNKLS